MLQGGGLWTQEGLSQAKIVEESMSPGTLSLTHFLYSIGFTAVFFDTELAPSLSSGWVSNSQIMSLIYCSSSLWFWIVNVLINAQ